MAASTKDVGPSITSPPMSARLRMLLKEKSGREKLLNAIDSMLKGNHPTHPEISDCAFEALVFLARRGVRT